MDLKLEQSFNPITTTNPKTRAKLDNKPGTTEKKSESLVGRIVPRPRTQTPELQKWEERAGR